MTRATKWVDDLVREWVGKVEDETQLAEWELLIGHRRAKLRAARHIPRARFVELFKTMKRGTRLYADGTFFLHGKEVESAYFMQYQPRAKRVWLAMYPDTKYRPGKRWDHMSLMDAQRLQLSPTELHVRQRAQKEVA